MQPALTNRIKDAALRLGFDLVGVAPVQPSAHAESYRKWIADGRHGEMSYLARPDAVEKRLQPEPQFRSAIVVALNYFSDGAPQRAGDAKIARYARGRDYHKVISPDSCI